MKKGMVFLTAALLACILASCARIAHCKECDDAVYRDGYCQYHYTLHSAKETVDSAAKGIYNSIFGD